MNKKIFNFCEFEMLITNINEVCVFGRNTEGQLGVGDDVNRITPEIIKKIFNIKSISNGLLYNIFLDFDGNIYSCGQNESDQLGLGYITPANIRIPTKINFNTKIIQVSSGFHHTIIIDKNYDLFAFGCNRLGQLGLPLDIKECNTPTALNIKAEKVFCGGNQTFIIDHNLDIWCFGSNASGQLGLETFDDFKMPTKLKFFEIFTQKVEIIDIKCGDYHTIFLDIEGNVYSCGYNLSGQLGLGNRPSKLESNTIQKLQINNICKISASCCYSLLLDNNGEVYSFGHNYYGQLGLSDNTNVDIPTKIINLPHIIDIFSHQSSSFLVDINKKVWCFGFNKKGNLGLGHNENINVPTLNPNLVDIESLNLINYDKRFKNTKSARNI